MKKITKIKIAVLIAAYVLAACLFNLDLYHMELEEPLVFFASLIPCVPLVFFVIHDDRGDKKKRLNLAIAFAAAVAIVPVIEYISERRYWGSSIGNLLGRSAVITFLWGSTLILYALRKRDSYKWLFCALAPFLISVIIWLLDRWAFITLYGYTYGYIGGFIILFFDLIKYLPAFISKDTGSGKAKNSPKFTYLEAYEQKMNK